MFINHPLKENIISIITFISVAKLLHHYGYKLTELLEQQRFERLFAIDIVQFSASIIPVTFCGLFYFTLYYY